MNRGFTIKIFVPGAADGLRIVEKSNWSGKGIICPRSIYPDSKGRPDFATTGIYILIGPTEQSDLPMIYVGEGDPVKPRLDSHYANKDFWTRAIFFVSKDKNLNKAHIQHIESRLVQLAQGAKRCVLDNGNLPSPPNMSEMDISEAEGFLDEILLCLPILGVNAFSKPEQAGNSKQLLHLKSTESEATGYEVADGFVVCKGSVARTTSTPSMHSHIQEIRQNLIDREIFTLSDNQYVLEQDYTFNSPSQAAGVMLGRNANGRVQWKTESGVTLKTQQEQNASEE